MVKKPKHVIIFSGYPGSGKTTVAKAIADKHKLRYVSGGYAFTKVVSDKGGADWWETEEGKAYLKDRENNLDLDKQVDWKMREEALKDKVVLDAFTQPWLLDFGLKIWIGASLEARAQRTADRSNITEEEATKRITARNETDARIYKKLYDFEYAPDPKVFDLMLDTTTMRKEEVFAIVDEAVSKYLKP